MVFFIITFSVLSYFQLLVGLPFKIEQDSGIITVNAEIDREENDQYLFEIFVTDSGQPVFTSSSTVTVTVMDVNDNPPQLQSFFYTAHLKEDDSDYGDIQTLMLVSHLGLIIKYVDNLTKDI